MRKDELKNVKRDILTIPFRYVPETLATIDGQIAALNERYDAVSEGRVTVPVVG